MKPTIYRPFLVTALAAVLALPLTAQLDDVKIEAIAVGDGVYMLTGRGGNLGVSIGESGVFLIDDQYAPLTDKIKAAIAELAEGPIRFVLNTHWHGDHTGGNENLGNEGALIVAHDNVRVRLSTEQFIEAFDSRSEPSPPAALPVVTFTDAVTFHLNGDEIHAFHVPPAHTDGDSIVHFRKANVVHMGDIFFNGMYPFIDTSSGGNVDGVLSAIEKALAMMDDETRVIPGHGPLTDRAGLAEYHAMIKNVRDRVAALKAAGKSLEEVVASAPTAEHDEKLGGGFLTSEQFVGFVYTSLPGE